MGFLNRLIAVSIGMLLTLAQAPPGTVGERHAVVLAQTTITCGHCRKSIEGAYVSTYGQPYHEACFLNHVAPRCAVCLGPITGQYFTDSWGNSFHAHHRTDNPQCTYCSRVMSTRTSRGAFVYNDGRPVCGMCVEAAVGKPEYGKELAATVRLWLQDWELAIPYDVIPLTMGNRNWLQDVRNHSQTLLVASEPTAFTSTVTRTAGNKVVSRAVAIYALDGLPREVFVGTIAHELMHVWNYLVCQVRHRASLEEGSANFIEAKVLEKLDTPAARQHLKGLANNPDPNYGGGYRRVKRLVASLGYEALLETLKTREDFPPGY